MSREIVRQDDYIRVVRKQRNRQKNIDGNKRSENKNNGEIKWKETMDIEINIRISKKNLKCRGEENDKQQVLLGLK